MPSRHIDIDGTNWMVYPSGYLTQSDADEFALLFVRGAASERVVRVTRYAPQGTRSREQSLAELTDAELRDLFAHSQESANSPEAGYAP